MSSQELDRSGTVTISDVARVAHVSPMTVSRVINSPEKVSGATAERVREAIDALGYTANMAARRLVSRRSHVIGLEAPKYDPTSGWASGIQAGAVERAAELGYEILLHPYLMNSHDVATKLTQLVRSGVADGLILFPVRPEHEQVLKTLDENGVRFVIFGAPTNCFVYPKVTTRDTAGATDMTNYLLSLGHKRIAIMLGPEYLQSSSERDAGFRAAMQSAGIAVDEQLVVRGDMRFETGLVLGRQLLQSKEPPTAIFAITDEMAAGVIQAAFRLGLRIPDDVSVCGFDDSSLAAKISPPLTTVNSPAHGVGAAAVELLVDRIERDIEGASKELATKLVVRESAGPPSTS